MKSLRQYIIPFKGLKNGIHELEFIAGDKFFEQYELLEIKKGNINISVSLHKKPEILILDFSIKGFVNVMCDRCLDEFNLPINYSGTIYVKFSEDKFQENKNYPANDLIFISSSENEINISHYIYEFIYLSLPYKRIHPYDEKGNSMCNKQMLNKIEEFTIFKKENKIEDPRWDKLKKLIVNKN